MAKHYETDSKGKLGEAITDIYATFGNDEHWPFVYKRYTDVNSPTKYSFTLKLAEFAGRVSNPEYAQKGIEAIKNLVVQLKRVEISQRVIEILSDIKVQRSKIGDNASVAAIDKAIVEIRVIE